MNRQIFDTDSDVVRRVVETAHWADMDDSERIRDIYYYVRDKIPFQFNKRESLRASDVLEMKSGSILGKSVLFKTLLEASDILSRFRAVLVGKQMFAGLPRSFRFNTLPEKMISCWIEVFSDGKWLVLDGMAYDKAYSEGLFRCAGNHSGEYVGFGAAVFSKDVLISPWNGKHRFFQRAAVKKDVGIVEDFDWFFNEYRKAIRSFSALTSGYTRKRMEEIRSIP